MNSKEKTYFCVNEDICGDIWIDKFPKKGFDEEYTKLKINSMEELCKLENAIAKFKRDRWG